MKKLIVIITCLLLVAALVCCNKKDPHVVTPTVGEVRVRFVVNEVLFGFTPPEDVVKTTGETGGEMPLPVDAVTTGDNYVLQWYYDEAMTMAYDPDAPIEEDVVLYLGEQGKEYTITYVRNEKLTYVGDFPETYTYGDMLVELPKIKTAGYPEYWYCVETDSEVKYVPTLAGQNVTLRAPDPIEYAIEYRTGLDEDVTMNNSANPAFLTVESAAFTLAAPAIEGREFVCWAIRIKNQTKRSVTIGDKTYTDNDEATLVTYEMVASGKIAFEAIWK